MLKYLATAALVCVASLSPAAEGVYTPVTILELPMIEIAPCTNHVIMQDGICMTFLGPQFMYVMFLLEGEPYEIMEVDVANGSFRRVWFIGELT